MMEFICGDYRCNAGLVDETASTRWGRVYCERASMERRAAKDWLTAKKIDRPITMNIRI
jgi:hypothetical protein